MLNLKAASAFCPKISIKKITLGDLCTLDENAVKIEEFKKYKKLAA